MLLLIKGLQTYVLSCHEHKCAVDINNRSKWLFLLQVQKSLFSSQEQNFLCIFVVYIYICRDALCAEVTTGYTLINDTILEKKKKNIWPQNTTSKEYYIKLFKRTE